MTLLPSQNKSFRLIREKDLSVIAHTLATSAQEALDIVSDRMGLQFQLSDEPSGYSLECAILSHRPAQWWNPEEIYFLREV